MRLKWLKNNQVLGDTQQGDKAASASSSSSTQPNDHRHDMFPSEPTSGLSIRRYDDFALAILIDRVKATDSANYSCVASNSAEVVSQIAELVVHGNYSLKNNQQHSTFLVFFYTQSSKPLSPTHLHNFTVVV
jgi:hypothetical protein